MMGAIGKTIADLVARNEALARECSENKLRARIFERDRERWKLLVKRLRAPMTPASSRWQIVETCPLHGDVKEVHDWQEQIDRALLANLVL
jgi:hypothetical protein